MQYAIFKVGEHECLVDIHEHIALTEHADGITDVEEDEATMPLKIVYGSYKTNPHIKNIESIKKNAELGKGYALGHVMGKECRAIELVDLELGEPIFRGRAIDIPFAALIRTHISIPDGKTQAVTAFLRYGGQMTPGTNILNRPGLFAIKSQERRSKKEVTKDNWRDMMDMERAIRAAEKSI